MGRSQLPRTDSYQLARKWPDKILSTPCEPCLFETKKQKRRVEDHCRRLGYIVRTDPGSAGMSAPQIGVPLRIVSFRDPNGDIHALCNPVIVERSEETNVDFEGCYSLPQRWFRVERADMVKVEYFNWHGEQGMFEATGYAARILQHEIDHLDGVVTLDRRIGEGEWTHPEVQEILASQDRKRADNR